MLTWQSGVCAAARGEDAEGARGRALRFRGAPTRAAAQVGPSERAGAGMNSDAGKSAGWVSGFSSGSGFCSRCRFFTQGLSTGSTFGPSWGLGGPKKKEFGLKGIHLGVVESKWRSAACVSGRRF